MELTELFKKLGMTSKWSAWKENMHMYASMDHQDDRLFVIHDIKNNNSKDIYLEDIIWIKVLSGDCEIITEESTIKHKTCSGSKFHIDFKDTHNSTYVKNNGNGLLLIGLREGNVKNPETANMDEEQRYYMLDLFRNQIDLLINK